MGDHGLVEIRVSALLTQPFHQEGVGLLQVSGGQTGFLASEGSENSDSQTGAEIAGAILIHSTGLEFGPAVGPLAFGRLADPEMIDRLVHVGPNRAVLTADLVEKLAGIAGRVAGVHRADGRAIAIATSIGETSEEESEIGRTDLLLRNLSWSVLLTISLFDRLGGVDALGREDVVVAADLKNRPEGLQSPPGGQIDRVSLQVVADPEVTGNRCLQTMKIVSAKRKSGVNGPTLDEVMPAVKDLAGLSGAEEASGLEVRRQVAPDKGALVDQARIDDGISDLPGFGRVSSQRLFTLVSELLRGSASGHHFGNLEPHVLRIAVRNQPGFIHADGGLDVVGVVRSPAVRSELPGLVLIPADHADRLEAIAQIVAGRFRVLELVTLAGVVPGPLVSDSHKANADLNDRNGDHSILFSAWRAEDLRITGMGFLHVF